MKQGETGRFVRADGDTHVLPIGDLREHLCHRLCWCRPTLQPLIESYGLKTLGVVIVHNSADGRELVERHGLQ